MHGIEREYSHAGAVQSSYSSHADILDFMTNMTGIVKITHLERAGIE